MIDRSVTVSCKPAGAFEGESTPEHSGQSVQPEAESPHMVDHEQPESDESEEVSDAPAE